MAAFSRWGRWERAPTRSRALTHMAIPNPWPSPERSARSAPFNATFQTDGKIVFGGQAKGLCKRGLRAQATRLTLANTPDPKFGNPPFFFGNGQCNGQDLVQAVTIAPNGKIVVGGIAAMPNFQLALGVARLNADGSLDQAWGNGGRVTTMFTGRADQVDALVVQPDGKVVAVGLIASDSMGNTAIVITRYLGP